MVLSPGIISKSPRAKLSENSKPIKDAKVIQFGLPTRILYVKKSVTCANKDVNLQNMVLY
jgi:hypothetical protein